MAGQAVAMERALVLVHEPPDALGRRGLVGMTSRVVVEEPEQRIAIHARSLAARPPQKARPKPAEKLSPSSEKPRSARKIAARSIVTRPLTP